MKALIRDISVAAVMAAGLSILPGCDGKAEPTNVSSAAPLEPPAAIAAAPEKQEPPTPPEHFYAMTEDGEYGYQQALSDDDIKAGRATSALLMVRYLGETKGVRSIMNKDGDVANVLSCAAPCKFVKSKIIYAGRVMRTDTVPVTDGSIVQVVMRDVFADRLTVYGKKAS